MTLQRGGGAGGGRGQALAIPTSRQIAEAWRIAKARRLLGLDSAPAEDTEQRRAA